MNHRAYWSYDLTIATRSHTTMPSNTFDRETLKKALKEALAETLHEERALLHEVFAEVLEDFALAETVREGRQTEPIGRNEVFDILQSKE